MRFCLIPKYIEDIGNKCDKSKDDRDKTDELFDIVMNYILACPFLYFFDHFMVWV
jgi:hypothetical protein